MKHLRLFMITLSSSVPILFASSCGKWMPSKKKSPHRALHERGLEFDVSKVTLYGNCDFKGGSTAFGTGSFNKNKLGKVGNDNASSLRVPQGFKVTLYEHDDKSGTSKTFTSDVKCLWNTDFNNKTTSLEVTRIEAEPSNMVTVYGDCKYKGGFQTFSTGNFNKNKLGDVRDNNASSLRVPAGYKVTLYDNNGRQGTSKTFTSDVECLWNTDFNNKTTSLTVSKIGEEESGKVTLYGDCGYKGDSTAFSAGSFNKNQLGDVGNDDVSSLRVPKGYQVKLYEHDGRKGTSKTYTSDVECLWNSGFNNKTTSLTVSLLGDSSTEVDNDTGDDDSNEDMSSSDRSIDIGTKFGGGVDQFYKDKGLSRSGDKTLKQMEAAIIAQDALYRGDINAARKIVKDIKSDMGGWYNGNWRGGNEGSTRIRLGDRGPMRSLMMMETVVDRADRKKSCDFTVLAIVARCQRIDGQDKIIDSRIAENDYVKIREAADIWLRWLGAITDTNPKLEFYEVDKCVGSWGSKSFPNQPETANQVPSWIRENVDQYIGIFPRKGSRSQMGGQGRYEEQAFLLNDDIAYLNHSGGPNGQSTNSRINGAWTNVERRLYFSDWFSHEFLHWLTWKYDREYKLEPYLHSWFNLSTWPNDFTQSGGGEAQYVREALTKRFFKDDGVDPLVKRLKKSKTCRSRGADNSVLTRN